MKVALSLIYPDNEFNSRGPIAPIDVVDLARSIGEDGLIQPVVITPLAADDKRRANGAQYLLVAGYRRYHAHKLLEWTEIECAVREDMDEIKCRVINLKENLDRKDLNILQEAKAISRLKELGVGEMAAAEQLGKSRGWIQVRYMLLDLPIEVQNEAASGIITQTDIRLIYSTQDPAERIAIAKKIKESVQRGEGKVAARAKAATRKHSDKKIRNKIEILHMMEYLQGTIGNGLWTRTLAWAIGEIDDFDLFKSVESQATNMGVGYVMPKNGEY